MPRLLNGLTIDDFMDYRDPALRMGIRNAGFTDPDSWETADFVFTIWLLGHNSKPENTVMQVSEMDEKMRKSLVQEFLQELDRVNILNADGRGFQKSRNSRLEDWFYFSYKYVMDHKEELGDDAKAFAGSFSKHFATVAGYGTALSSKNVNGIDKRNSLGYFSPEEKIRQALRNMNDLAGTTNQAFYDFYNTDHAENVRLVVEEAINKSNDAHLEKLGLNRHSIEDIRGLNNYELVEVHSKFFSVFNDLEAAEKEAMQLTHAANILGGFRVDGKPVEDLVKEMERGGGMDPKKHSEYVEAYILHSLRNPVNGRMPVVTYSPIRLAVDEKGKDAHAHSDSISFTIASEPEKEQYLGQHAFSPLYGQTDFFLQKNKEEQKVLEEKWQKEWQEAAEDAAAKENARVEADKQRPALFRAEQKRLAEEKEKAEARKRKEAAINFNNKGYIRRFTTLKKFYEDGIYPVERLQKTGFNITEKSTDEMDNLLVMYGLGALNMSLTEIAEAPPEKKREIADKCIADMEAHSFVSGELDAAAVENHVKWHAALARKAVDKLKAANYTYPENVFGSADAFGKYHETEAYAACFYMGQIRTVYMQFLNKSLQRDAKRNPHKLDMFKIFEEGYGSGIKKDWADMLTAKSYGNLARKAGSPARTPRERLLYLMAGAAFADRNLENKNFFGTSSFEEARKIQNNINNLDLSRDDLKKLLGYMEEYSRKNNNVFSDENCLKLLNSRNFKQAVTEEYPSAGRFYEYFTKIEKLSQIDELKDTVNYLEKYENQREERRIRAIYDEAAASPEFKPVFLDSEIKEIGDLDDFNQLKTEAERIDYYIWKAGGNGKGFEYSSLKGLPYEIKNSGNLKDLYAYYNKNQRNLGKAAKAAVLNRIRVLRKAEAQREKAVNGTYDEEILANRPQVVSDGPGKASIDVSLDRMQSSANGCWSCSYEVLLKGRGVKVTQEEIRAYRAPYTEETLSNPLFKKNIDENLNTDKMIDITERADAALAFAPDSMLRTFEIQHPERARDTLGTNENFKNEDYIEAAAEEAARRIYNAIYVDKSPVAFTSGDHYYTITDINGDEITCINSNKTNVKEKEKLKLKNVIRDLYAMGSTAQFVWMSDVKLRPDGRTFYNVPSSYLEMNEDGSLKLPPVDLQTDANVEKTLAEAEGVRVRLVGGTEDTRFDRLKRNPLNDKNLLITEQAYVPKKLNAARLKEAAGRRSAAENEELERQRRQLLGEGKKDPKYELPEYTDENLIRERVKKEEAVLVQVEKERSCRNVVRAFNTANNLLGMTENGPGSEQLYNKPGAIAMFRLKLGYENLRKFYTFMAENVNQERYQPKLDELDKTYNDLMKKMDRPENAIEDGLVKPDIYPFTFYPKSEEDISEAVRCLAQIADGYTMPDFYSIRHRNQKEGQRYNPSLLAKYAEALKEFTYDTCTSNIFKKCAENPDYNRAVNDVLTLPFEDRTNINKYEYSLGNPSWGAYFAFSDEVVKSFFHSGTESAVNRHKAFIDAVMKEEGKGLFPGIKSGYMPAEPEKPEEKPVEEAPKAGEEPKTGEQSVIEEPSKTEESPKTEEEAPKFEEQSNTGEAGGRGPQGDAPVPENNTQALGGEENNQNQVEQKEDLTDSNNNQPQVEELAGNNNDQPQEEEHIPDNAGGQTGGENQNDNQNLEINENRNVSLNQEDSGGQNNIQNQEINVNQDDNQNQEINENRNVSLNQEDNGGQNINQNLEGNGGQNLEINDNQNNNQNQEINDNQNQEINDNQNQEINDNQNQEINDNQNQEINDNQNQEINDNQDGNQQPEEIQQQENQQGGNNIIRDIIQEQINLQLTEEEAQLYNNIAQNSTIPMGAETAEASRVLRTAGIIESAVPEEKRAAFRQYHEGLKDRFLQCRENERKLYVYDRMLERYYEHVQNQNLEDDVRQQYADSIAHINTLRNNTALMGRAASNELPVFTAGLKGVTEGKDFSAENSLTSPKQHALFKAYLKRNDITENAFAAPLNDLARSKGIPEKARLEFIDQPVKAWESFANRDEDNLAYPRNELEFAEGHFDALVNGVYTPAMLEEIKRNGASVFDLIHINGESAGGIFKNLPGNPALSEQQKKAFVVRKIMEGRQVDLARAERNGGIDILPVETGSPDEGIANLLHTNKENNYALNHYDSIFWNAMTALKRPQLDDPGKGPAFMSDQMKDVPVKAVEMDEEELNDASDYFDRTLGRLITEEQRGFAAESGEESPLRIFRINGEPVTRLFAEKHPAGPEQEKYLKMEILHALSDPTLKVTLTPLEKNLGAVSYGNARYDLSYAAGESLLNKGAKEEVVGTLRNTAESTAVLRQTDRNRMMNSDFYQTAREKYRAYVGNLSKLCSPKQNGNAMIDHAADGNAINGNAADETLPLLTRENMNAFRQALREADTAITNYIKEKKKSVIMDPMSAKRVEAFQKPLRDIRKYRKALKAVQENGMSEGMTVFTLLHYQNLTERSAVRNAQNVNHAENAGNVNNVQSVRKVQLDQVQKNKGNGNGNAAENPANSENTINTGNEDNIRNAALNNAPAANSPSQLDRRMADIRRVREARKRILAPAEAENGAQPDRNAWHVKYRVGKRAEGARAPYRNPRLNTEIFISARDKTIPDVIKNTPDITLIRDFRDSNMNDLLKADPLYLEYLEQRIINLTAIRQAQSETRQKIENGGRRPEAASPVKRDGRIMLENVNQSVPQSSSQGCASMAYANLLLSRGVRLTQEQIRGCRPDYTEEEAGSLNAFETTSLNSDAGMNPFDYADLLMSTVPNTAMKSFNVTLQRNASEDYIKDVSEELQRRTSEAVIRDKSPVALKYDGHYYTITGIEGDLIYMKDSRNQSNPNRTQVVRFQDIVRDICNNQKSGTEQERANNGKNEIQLCSLMDLHKDGEGRVSEFQGQGIEVDENGNLRIPEDQMVGLDGSYWILEDKTNKQSAVKSREVNIPRSRPGAAAITAGYSVRYPKKILRNLLPDAPAPVPDPLQAAATEEQAGPEEAKRRQYTDLAKIQKILEGTETGTRRGSNSTRYNNMMRALRNLRELTRGIASYGEAFPEPGSDRARQIRDAEEQVRRFAYEYAENRVKNNYDMPEGKMRSDLSMVMVSMLQPDQGQALFTRLNRQLSSSKAPVDVKVRIKDSVERYRLGAERRRVTDSIGRMVEKYNGGREDGKINDRLLSLLKHPESIDEYKEMLEAAPERERNNQLIINEDAQNKYETAVNAVKEFQKCRDKLTAIAAGDLPASEEQREQALQEYKALYEACQTALEEYIGPAQEAGAQQENRIVNTEFFRKTGARGILLEMQEENDNLNLNLLNGDVNRASRVKVRRMKDLYSKLMSEQRTDNKKNMNERQRKVMELMNRNMPRNANAINHAK